MIHSFLLIGQSRVHSLTAGIDLTQSARRDTEARTESIYGFVKI